MPQWLVAADGLARAPVDVPFSAAGDSSSPLDTLDPAAIYSKRALT
jgi:hypothetical protein